MQIRILVFVLTVLAIVMPVRAQNSSLPVCSDSSLANITELQPAYESLIEGVQSFGSPGGLLAFIESYFRWRKQLWSQLPLCAELVEIAVLMNTIASNQVASPALNRALHTSHYSLHSNPYSDQEAGEVDLPNLLSRRIEAAHSLLGDDAQDPAEVGALPACSDADKDIFYAEVFDPYFALIKTFQQSATVSDLLTLIDSLLEWRRAVWLGLPACEGMAEITWHISNSASDMAVLLAFYLADMKPEFDLYSAESSRTSATIAELTPAFVGSPTSDLKLPESTLPSCTQSELNVAVDIIVEYAELVEAANAVSSIADVFAFSERQYQWREMRLSALERCAEIFELGLLFDQSAGDAVVTMALLLSGVDADDIPHVEAMQAGAAKMSALVTPIIQGERAGTDSPAPGPLPQCSDEELGVISSEIEPEYWELIAADYAAETIEDFLRVGEMQIEFRDTIWSQLPACAQAYDIAWLMYRVTGDSILTMALLVAGAAEDVVPYSATVDDMSRLTTMLNEFGDATDNADG